MNDEARGRLCEVIKEHGRGIIDNPEWIEGILLASLTNYPRELNVLLAAMHEDIPAAIRSVSRPISPEFLNELSCRLEDCHMIKAEAAEWAVKCWAEAMAQIAAPQHNQMPVTGGLQRLARPLLLRSRMAIEVQARPVNSRGSALSCGGPRRGQCRCQTSTSTFSRRPG